MSSLLNESENVKIKLWRLKAFKDVSPHSLTGEAKKDFESLSRDLSLSVDQPAYVETYNLIHSTFGSETPLLMGTVGQYFAARLEALKRNNSVSGCHYDAKACSRQIYNCIYTPEKGYLFLPKNRVESKEAYLYMMEFHGFSREELTHLANQGHDRVYIRDFAEQPFANVSSNATLAELEKENLRPTKVLPTRSEKSDSAMIYLIVFLVLFLLIILALTYFHKYRAT